MRFSIAIHGGAGALTDVQEHRQALQEILLLLQEQGQQGVSAMDLVETAVVALEDNELFNAGKGSVLNAEGAVECDASIMDGRDLNAGAVAGVSGVKNPVSLARKVITDSPHVMLIGAGANEFAIVQGLAKQEQGYFITKARKKQLAEAKKSDKIVLDHSDQAGHKDQDKKLGTVGAVAIDSRGDIAAATSTGGIVNKRYGRVGDSPIVGAGVYAENGLCAVSATGYGEQFIRTSLAKHIAEYMRYHEGIGAEEAAKEGIRFLVERVDGLGGVIVVDSAYRVGYAHSTQLILAGSVNEANNPELFF